MTNRTEIIEIRDGPSNALVSKERRKYKTFAWGEELVEETIDPDSANLWTVYDYIAGVNVGLRSELRRWDGYWEKYDYYSYPNNNRLYHKKAAFMNFNTNAADSNVRVTTCYYGTNAVPGAGDDGSIDPETPRGIVEQYPNRTIYNILLPGERRQIIGTTGLGWNYAGNLVTITRYFTNGPWKGDIISIKNPDGTMRVFDYSTNSAGTLRTNTVWSGAVNGSGTVTNGTKTVTVLGVAGQTYSRLVTDVASGLTLESETYTLDEQNRPIAITYLDGTTTGTSYDCCGVSAVTNREGTVTLLEYDDLKRRTAERLLLGDGAMLSTVYQLDAADNVRSITRQGTNGSSIVLKSSGYDSAGRLMAETNAVGAVTTYAYGTPVSFCG